MKIRTTLAALALAALPLAACGSAEREPIRAAAPAADPVVSGATDQQIALLALESTWAQTPASARADMCAGWEVAPSLMVEALMDGSGEVGEALGAKALTDFFDGKCRP